jgi:hypothetical protein
MAFSFSDVWRTEWSSRHTYANNEQLDGPPQVVQTLQKNTDTVVTSEYLRTVIQPEDSHL